MLETYVIHIVDKLHDAIALEGAPKQHQIKQRSIEKDPGLFNSVTLVIKKNKLHDKINIIFNK